MEDKSFKVRLLGEKGVKSINFFFFRVKSVSRKSKNQIFGIFWKFLDFYGGETLPTLEIIRIRAKLLSAI